MKFDPRYAILAVLLILAVVKITMKKEPYMCGGKREGYKVLEAVKKEGNCAKCGAGGQTYGKPCKCSKGGKEGYCSSCSK
jgi:hypothetical protein